MVDIFNNAERSARYMLFMQEIELEKEAEYLVFDYWNAEFIGKIRNNIELEFKPCESRAKTPKSEKFWSCGFSPKKFIYKIIRLS